MFRMYSKWMIDRYHDDGNAQLPSWLVRAIERDPELQKHCSDLEQLSLQLSAVSSISEGSPSNELSQGSVGKDSSQTQVLSNERVDLSKTFATSRRNLTSGMNRPSPKIAREWNRGLVAGVAFCSVLCLFLGFAVYYSTFATGNRESLVNTDNGTQTAESNEKDPAKRKISGKQLVESGMRMSKNVVSKWNSKREEMKTASSNKPQDWSFSQAELATLGRSSLRYLVYRIPIAVIQVLGLNQTSSSSKTPTTDSSGSTQKSDATAQ